MHDISLLSVFIFIAGFTWIWDDKATTDLKLFGVNLKWHEGVVGRISLSIKTKLQKQKLHDEESGAKDEEIERKMEIGQRV